MLLCDILPEEGERTHTLADHRDGECKWPVFGAGHTARFCCAPAEPGKPYCAGHAWDAMNPRNRRGPRP